MSHLESKSNRRVSSKTEANTVESKTEFKVESKSHFQLNSELEAATERAAFLTTAKRNASIMFAKYL